MRVLLAIAVLVSLCLPMVAEDTRRAQADELSAQGRSALMASNTDGAKSVDAALAFTKALALYRDLADTEATCEMQASLFWCRKRMNEEQLHAFLAAAKADTKAAGVASAELERVVAVSEAVAYLERAEAYRRTHPDRHFQLLMLYSEIQQRFPETPQATTATAVVGREQQAWMQQVAAERAKEQADLDAQKAAMAKELAGARASRFALPLETSSASTRSAMPPRTQVDEALALLKRTYAADYARTKIGDRRVLAKQLLADAEENRSDAPAYQAILEESTRLAVDTDEIPVALDATEALALAFLDFDLNAGRRAAFGKVRRAPSVAAATLIDAPADRSANLLLGRHICFELGIWDDGLPLLAQSGDKELTTAAECDLAKPVVAAEYERTGAAWQAAGKARQADRIPCYSRAAFWYRQAIGGLTGLRKEAVNAALAEIEKVLPVEVSDWNQISITQWERLPGKPVIVPSKADRTLTQIRITSAHAVRVVPQPDQRGLFRCGVDKGKKQVPGIITSTLDGLLWIEPVRYTTKRVGKRTIREPTNLPEKLLFKVVPVEDAKDGK